jgi:pyruvate-formate lyase-activating enzyme
VKSRKSPPVRLLLADPDGNVHDHPSLLAVCRDGVGDQPGDEPLALLGAISPRELGPLPDEGKLVTLPGRLPIGLDPATGQVEVVERINLGGKRFRPTAVAAMLPPGWSRTRMPAAACPPGAPVLPQWAYAAAGFSGEGAVACSQPIDHRTHWDPPHFSTADLPALVEARHAACPGNRVYEQLATCALQYRCVTAQNTFYQRWEGALPVSSKCNADCVTCISLQPRGDGGPASHERITRSMEAAQLAQVAIHHLETAERPMISFGQGCEGEPTMRAEVIAEAIRLTRAATSRGRLNINTNGSKPRAIEALIAAGLNSIRVSLNSAIPERYAHQYRPIGYTFAEVEESIRVAVKAGIFSSLNLLTVPGVTDSEPEVEALCGLVARTGVQMVQVRDLAVDPDLYLAQLPRPVGRPLGLPVLLDRLRAARPALIIGSYNVSVEEEATVRSWTELPSRPVPSPSPPPPSPSPRSRDRRPPPAPRGKRAPRTARAH